MKTIIQAAISIVIIAMLSIILCEQHSTHPQPEPLCVCDTLVIHDTIIVHDTIKKPVPVWEELMYVDTVWLEKVAVDIKHDTMRVSNRLASGHTNGRPKSHIQGYVNDSVPVLIPITERTFKGNNYKAVVSGFDPKLVSLDIYQQTETITKTITKQPKVVVGIGPYAGYGNKGFNYGIAVNVSMPIWSW